MITMTTIKNSGNKKYDKMLKIKNSINLPPAQTILKKLMFS